MKSIATILLILISVSALAQNVNDSSAKRDTLEVPLYEQSDTVKVKLILYGDQTSGNVKFVTGGYAVRRGFVRQKDKEWYWHGEPTIILFLDSRKKPIPNVIQFY